MFLACTIIGSFLGGWRIGDRSVSRLKAKVIAAEARRDAALARRDTALASARLSENKRVIMEQRLAIVEFLHEAKLNLERSRTQDLKTRLEAAEALNAAVERHKPNSDTSGNR